MDEKTRFFFLNRPTILWQVLTHISAAAHFTSGEVESMRKIVLYSLTSSKPLVDFYLIFTHDRHKYGYPAKMGREISKFRKRNKTYLHMLLNDYILFRNWLVCFRYITGLVYRCKPSVTYCRYLSKNMLSGRLEWHSCLFHFWRCSNRLPIPEGDDVHDWRYVFRV